MEKRGSGETPSVIRFIGGAYKVMAISSELMARVKDESSSVVYKEIVKETMIR